MNDTQAREAVMRWRGAERRRLIDERLAFSVTQRQSAAVRIAAHLGQWLGDCTGLVVSAYWPLRGEPDLRSWMTQLCRSGARCALPVVVTRHAPLVFRRWEPGCLMTRGIWGIAVPADEQEVVPDVLVAPVVGFDPQCYRLGYGGGYFDRTLAARGAGATVVGVGYEAAALDSIRPLPHDIPLQAVVTEVAIHGLPARAPSPIVPGAL